MKWLVALLAATVAATAVLAPAPPARAQDLVSGRWVPYRLSRGTVEFPRRPLRNSGQRVSNGSMSDAVRLDVDKRVLLLFLVSTALTPGALGDADRALRSSVESVRRAYAPATLASATPLTVLGYPARDAVIVDQVGSVEKVRAVFADDAVYVMVTMARKSEMDAPDIAAISTRFRDSLQILR